MVKSQKYNVGNIMKYQIYDSVRERNVRFK
eukprot:SAG22_NODE_11250_length_493_cov_21.982234_1_plen_29_part_10